ncbi:activator of HSP90 ATPase [Chitinophaga polysaccharea]|uniref:SRPBCC family protein n=1 Tax=Chitinophaga TaxID=79328 RepID=UPI001454E9B1|nr:MULTISPECIES: SRPBCC family protein [Chitinophaga]NLR56962.1 activator of HSP90 ATPase [Chitinophaga polysaccharea]NLU93164.1 activator of HSP90 ATPase [Chitinophaga sp. Ak27]
MSNKVTVTATVHADRKKVWDYYNRPEHITKWNFADPSWHCPSASNDLRVGGKYAARMEAKDGSFGFDFEAVYDEVVDGEKFTYTMPNGRQASVSFKKKDDQTEVDVAFDPETEHPIEMQKNGWQAILNNFKSYTEAN